MPEYYETKDLNDWQRWAPYAAVKWSLICAALGGYWAVIRTRRML